MSSEALDWAFTQTDYPSAVRLTLLALCHCANHETGDIFPSVAHLMELTSQNRKTIIANIGKLEAAGTIVDTGRRAGKTKQIKVYKAAIQRGPKTEPFHKRDSLLKDEPSQKGDCYEMKESQKRNGSVLEPKESQKRDTEPSIEPSRYIYLGDEDEQDQKRDSFDWIPAPEFEAYLASRMEADRPVTNQARALLVEELRRFEQQGQDLRTVIETATVKGWKSFYPVGKERGGRNARSGISEDPNGGTNTGAFTLAAALTGGVPGSAAYGPGRDARGINKEFGVSGTPGDEGSGPGLLDSPGMGRLSRYSRDSFS